MATSYSDDRDAEQQRGLDILKRVVDAQLWNAVPHHYTVNPPSQPPVGSGITFWDADGRVSGTAPDSGHAIDKEGIAYKLTKPPDPPAEEEVIPDPPPLTGLEKFEAEAALQRWRRQFTDPKMRERAQNALRKRQVYKPRTKGTKVGAPRKYTEHGALMEFAVKQEKPDVR